jgi:threonine dehydrogenase-like Zn-dependent dehydrogenase
MGVTNGGNPDAAPHFHGGYGEYAYAPVANLIRVPDGLDPKMVCVYACAGPTTMHAFSLAAQANCGLEKARVAVVQGLGPVGTFAIMYLKTLGVEHIIAVTGRDQPAKKEMAMRLGATEVHSVQAEGEEAIIARVREISGIGADLVFEGSGNPAAIPQGMAMLRNRGTYLVPGQYSNSGSIPIQPQMITFKALQIIGSSQYSMADVREYLAFLCAHPECHDTIRALGSCYPVEQVNQAFADAEAGKNIKTLLVN